MIENQQEYDRATFVSYHVEAHEPNLRTPTWRAVLRLRRADGTLVEYTMVYPDVPALPFAASSALHAGHTLLAAVRGGLEMRDRQQVRAQVVTA